MNIKGALFNWKCSSVLIITLGLLLAVGISGKLPRTSSDVRSLFPKHSNQLNAYNKTNSLFGHFLNDVIVVQVGENLSDHTREELFEIEERISLLEGVAEIVSPAPAFSINISSPLPLRNKPHTAARFFLKIQGDLLDQERADLDSEINRILKDYPNLVPSRIGAFFISESVSKVVDRETKSRVPITIAVLLIVASLIFRSIEKAVIILITPALSVLWVTLGSALLELPLGPISQLVPPFILAIGASYSVHVATRLLATSSKNYENTLREMRKAIGIAALTTIIGLSSLLFMDIQAIIEFAVLASAGVLLSAVLSILITPLFVSRSNYKKGAKSLWAANFEPAKWKLLVCIVLLFTIVTGAGIPKIFVHTDPMMFLPKNSWERRQIDASIERFPGNRMLSIVFSRKTHPLNEADFELLAQLSKQVRSMENVYSVVTDSDFKSVADLKKDFSVMGTSSRPAPIGITLEDLSASRLIFETNLEGAELIELVRMIEQTINNSLESEKNTQLNFYTTGIELLIAEQTSTIVWGIIKSLFFTLVVIAVILSLLFKDLRLVVVGLIPNIIPVTVVLGSIGWIYGDINLGASLVGAAALSIAVDNTFHFLISWKEKNDCKNFDMHTPFACAHAMSQCFPSFITTSIVLTSGFMTMAFSQVLPVQQFGLLLSITLIIGLMADIVVLPYLISRYEKAQG